MGVLIAASWSHRPSIKGNLVRRLVQGLEDEAGREAGHVVERLVLRQPHLLSSCPRRLDQGDGDLVGADLGPVIARSQLGLDGRRRQVYDQQLLPGPKPPSLHVPPTDRHVKSMDVLAFWNRPPTRSSSWIIREA